MITKREVGRIAYVSAVGATGGGERVLMELARGAAHQGWTAEVFCLRDGAWSQGTWGTDVAISAFGNGYRIRYPWTVIRAARWLRHQLREFRPTVVHANHASWWIAAWATRGMNVATVWHLHDFPDDRDLPTRVGERFPPSATLFTTDHVASGFPTLQAKQHAVIAPVTIDVDHFRTADRDASVLSKHAIKPEQFFLTVCRWQPHKGLHDLVTAVAGLSVQGSKCRGVKYLIVGRPSNADEARYQQSVLERMHELGVRDSFVLIDECTDAQLRSLYTAAIALVHPATSEGFGLVLLEAMSLGLPVIACDAAGPSTILDRENAGILVPKGCPTQIGEAIQSVLLNPCKRKVLAEGGTTRASQLSRDQMIEQTLALYDSVTSDGTR